MPSPDEYFAYRLTVAYDGRAYHGWQRLANAPTVQGVLEDAIRIATGEDVKVVGAGRTDRGAHALGQVAGVRLAADHDPASLQAAVDDALPDDVDLVSVERAAADFHARESAVGKIYEYRIHVGETLPEGLDLKVWHVRTPLDIIAMKRGLRHLIGRHDFASFGTPSRPPTRSTVCDLVQATVFSAGDTITFRFDGDRFLNHMVRNIVRAIVKVGEGRFVPAQISKILAAKARKAAPGSAPSSGLYLIRVDYDATARAARAPSENEHPRARGRGAPGRGRPRGRQR